MVVKADYERIKTLLKDTITLLCRNGLSFKTEFSVEALIGITLDKEDVFLVSINEIIRSELGTQLAMAKAAEERTMAAKEEDGNSSDLQPATPSSTNGHHYRKRKHSVEHASPQEPAEDGQESESGDDDERGLENADLLIDDSNSEPASKKTVSDLSMPTTQTKNDDTNDIVYIKEEIDTGDWPGDSQAEESFSDMSIPPASSSNQQHNDNFDFLQGSSLVPVSSDSSGRQSWPEVMPSQSTSSNMNVSLSKRTSTLTGSEPSTQGEHSQQRYGLMVCSSMSASYLLPVQKEDCPPDAMPVCRLCNKSFGSKFSYTRHMAQHWGRFTYSCDICGQGFMVKGSLENHRRNHTGERLICVCGAKFVSYQGYRQHQRKYKCLDKYQHDRYHHPVATATSTSTATGS